MARGDTYESTPCKHCGVTTKYKSSRRCINFYNIKGHMGMTYVPPVEHDRECKICNVRKPLDDFNFRGDSGRHRTQCRQCRNADEAAKRYGTTLEHVAELSVKQGAVCAICESATANHSTFTRLAIDHCHTTGKVRGLLCHNCNTALGHLKDSPELALKAAAYLLASK